jgi:hypothetical protein
MAVGPPSHTLDRSRYSVESEGEKANRDIRLYRDLWVSSGHRTRPTRMRPPLVKRQTLPMSGFSLFLPLTGSGVVRSQARVLTGFPGAGASPARLHHTRLAARSPPGWRVQSTVGVLLCGLELRLCPPAVLVKGGAKPVRLAS